MRKKIAVLISLIMILSVAACLFTACSGSPAIGFWTIDEVTAGEVVMTEDDANNLGMSVVGSVKLQKSGVCKVTFLDVEEEGTWTEAEDGTLTIKYGEDQVLTGSIDEEGLMHLTDPQGAQYKLSK